MTDLSTSGLHFLPMLVGSWLQRRGGAGAVTAQPAWCSQLLVESISVVWMHGTRGTQLT